MNTNSNSNLNPEKPSICAVILDYFGSDKTITCLSSLFDKGFDTVMIVDNSGDRQANTKLQEAMNEFRQREVPFTIHQIVNQHNLGFAKGVNDALRWLEINHPHSYYLLINNDAEATPGMLHELLTFMKENKNTVLTAPVMDDGYNKIEYNWYHRLTGLLFFHQVFGAFPYLSGCCLLVDHRIVKNGLFDEDFFMYGEDVELTWRVRMSGYKTACVDKAIVKHEVTGSSHQGGFFYEYYMVIGHILLAWKLARHQREIPFLFLGRLPVMTARAIMRSIRFRSWIPIKASLQALRDSIIINKKVTIKTGAIPHV